jgi:hypothetical protein
MKHAPKPLKKLEAFTAGSRGLINTYCSASDLLDRKSDEESMSVMGGSLDSYPKSLKEAKR